MTSGPGAEVDGYDTHGLMSYGGGDGGGGSPKGQPGPRSQGGEGGPASGAGEGGGGGPGGGHVALSMAPGEGAGPGAAGPDGGAAGRSGANGAGASPYAVRLEAGAAGPQIPSLTVTGVACQALLIHSAAARRWLVPPQAGPPPAGAGGQGAGAGPGRAALRGSVTSETAVGPPSAMDGGGGAGAGLRSVSSPAPPGLPEVGAAKRPAPGACTGLRSVAGHVPAYARCRY
jgi:hypothetical protein